MEFAEAGVHHLIPSSSSVPPTSSHTQPPSSHINGGTSLDPEAKRRAMEEKKQRKAERAMKRAAKEARRQQREARATNAALVDEKPEKMESTLGASQFAVSISPDKELAAMSSMDGEPQPIIENPPMFNASMGDNGSPKPGQIAKQPPVSNPQTSPDESGPPTSQVSNIRGNAGPDLNPSAPADPASPPPPSPSKGPTPRAISSKRARPSENAEAGPSTTKVPKKAPKTPVRNTATRKRTAQRSPSKMKEDDPWPFSRSSSGDEDVRAKLSNQSAVNDFLAAKFWPIPYLHRLEASGILTIKKGKLENEEIRAVRRHLDVFKQTYRLSDESLVDVIMAKGKNNAREDYPDFWHDIALEIPGRPLRYVVKQVQRMYDPRGRKGPWTADEDNDLIRAVNVHPGQWLKIAAIVERTEQDCRDRWNKELANLDKRSTGQWTAEEEKRLTRAVKSANLAIGADPLSSSVPWDVVSVKMDHTRGPTQCRIKWQRDLLPRAQGFMSPTTKAKPATRLKPGSTASSGEKKEKVYKSAEHYTSDQEEDEDEDGKEEEEGVVVSESEKEEGIEVDSSPDHDQEDELEEIESGSE